MRIIILVVALLLPAMCLAQEAGKDPVVRVTADETSAVPGQPIVVRVTVLVPTWMPKPPVMPTYDVPNVAVRQDGRKATAISEQIDGETWSGISRKYVLFPLIPGRIELPAQTVVIQYADPDSSDPIRFEATTEPIILTGELPEGAEGLDPFLAATGLSIEQSFDREIEELEPGDAIVRNVIVKIEGTIPMSIPPFAASEPTPVVAIYSDEPTLAESFDRGVMSGSRTERITFVAKAGGRFEAAPMTLKWFNLETSKVETASADGFELVVAGSPPVTVEPRDWRGIVAAWLPLLAAGLILCLLILRYLPRAKAWYRAHCEAYRASELFAYRRAEQALQRRQLGTSLRAIRAWWSFWQTADQNLPNRLSRDLLAAGAKLYGTNSEPDASGKAFEAATNSLAEARKEKRQAEKNRDETALPALNPTATTRGV